MCQQRELSARVLLWLWHVACDFGQQRHRLLVLTEPIHVLLRVLLALFELSAALVELLLLLEDRSELVVRAYLRPYLLPLDPRLWLDLRPLSSENSEFS
jgi:hypothetical protein